MRLYPFRTPRIMSQWIPWLVWYALPNTEKTLYLTFDDGPHPEATTYVMDLLAKYEAKATFFVVGENARKHPNLIATLKAHEHKIGNHTAHHLSGWKTSRTNYVDDVEACEQFLHPYREQGEKKLFRPPYGRITPGQINALRPQYEIVMWSLLSGDFDPHVNLEASKRALNQSKVGDIIVFHDSLKSLPNLKQLLPWFLESFHHKGYKFVTL